MYKYLTSVNYSYNTQGIKLLIAMHSIDELSAVDCILSSNLCKNKYNSKKV